jgi:N-acetylglucosamine kinase-like BadF-type ATPase
VKRPVVVAIDGGGSKLDGAVVGRDGTVLGCVRVPSASGNGGEPDNLAAIDAAVAATCRRAGLDPDRRPAARLGVFCLAGADLPVDDRRIRRWLERSGWTTETVLRNDTFAVLRAGTDRAWGVGVVCGFGTNCVAVSPTGHAYRLPALGRIAGDWGGGADIGEAALWHAQRARDGRGGRTLLASTVPAYFGFRRPRQVMEAIHLGHLRERRLSELSPLVFEAAAGGDGIARSIVDRQADEVVTMATTAIRRLRMSRLDVDVVLGGGIFRNGFAPFLTRIEEGIAAIAPRATVEVLTAPPVVGSALLGLDRLGAPRAATVRLRETLTHEALDGHRHVDRGR